MKRILYVLIILSTALSCSKDEETAPNEYPQHWELIKMSGNTPNSETTGVAMAWEESYLLMGDNTFTKMRRKDDVLSHASGTYSIGFQDDVKYLKLIYESENDLIGNCSVEPEEFLTFEDDLLVASWEACDGPGLVYEKQNHRFVID